MKKILLLLTAFFTMSAYVQADGLTATLQQGDVMTPFYGVDAFKQAYEAADSGAVITLSSGSFNTVTELAKPVTLIGAYAFNASSPEVTILPSLTIKANYVKVEGIYFSGNVSLDAIKNCQIKRCWIKIELNSTAAHTNTLIDQCVVKYDYAVANGQNYCIKNSTLLSFYAMNTTSNLAYITNCVVWEYKGGKRPYAIYKNSMLGSNSPYESLDLYSSSEFYNNIFFNTYSSYKFTASFPSGCINEGNINGKNWSDYFTSLDTFYPAPHFKDGVNPLGQDGTQIGIYGGTGFSEYPNIPRVLNKEVDSNTNAEGKINVKITVKAE